MVVLVLAHYVSQAHLFDNDVVQSDLLFHGLSNGGFARATERLSEKSVESVHPRSFGAVARECSPQSSVFSTQTANLSDFRFELVNTYWSTRNRRLADEPAPSREGRAETHTLETAQLAVHSVQCS